MVFTLSSNEAHLGYDCNTHAIPSDFLYSIAYFFAKIKEPARCGKLLRLSYLDFSFQSGERLHFLFLCRFIIYVHRRCNIGVSHNLLNDLEIRFILAKACAEGMAKIVAAKVRQKLRLSSFFFRRLFLLRVIRLDNAVKYPVYKVGYVSTAVFVLNAPCGKQYALYGKH